MERTLDKEAISKRLAELRSDRKLKQKEVAASIGVTSATLSTYETGAKFPSLEVAAKLADFYGVSLDYLLCTGYEFVPAIKTYGDIVRVLIDIDIALGGLDFISDDDSSEFSLAFSDRTLKSFYQKSDALRGAFSGLESGREYYKDWLNSTLTQLDSKTLGPESE